MRHSRGRLAHALIALAAFAVALWCEFAPTPWVSHFGNELVRDGFIRLQAGTAAEPRILVVDIDEASLAELGPWPWPRGRLADLAEILLTRYEGRGVALDVLLPEPGDAAGDVRLGLLARHAPLVLAQAFDYSLARPQMLRAGRLAGARPDLPGAAVEASGYIGNHAGLAGAAHVGNIGFIPDSDGTLRRIPLVTSFEGQRYPALSLALLRCCSAGPAPALGPLMRLDYRRDWNAYTVVSAADILRERIDPASARGRLVLVGSSSLGLGDRVTTPLGASRPGLGAQAVALSTLLDRQAGLAPAPWPGRLAACVYAAAAALLAAWAFPRLSALASVGLLGALAGLWLAAAALLVRHDADFMAGGPLATLLFLLVVAVPFQWQLAQRSSRRLLETLGQYVAPSVVEEMLRRGLGRSLAPRQCDVTTLIADMEGYTSQVEALPVEEAARLTRAFLDCLTGPVMEGGGTIDKYTGDGLVAFWGAPLPLPEHADLALDAASAILQRVAALSAERERAGYPRLRVRIGIESGLAVAGDFGGALRSIYTAVGDSVNTAARLEQAARDFPHDVIVGGGTVERATRHRFIPLGEWRLRGKERATMLYSLELPGAGGVAEAT